MARRTVVWAALGAASVLAGVLAGAAEAQLRRFELGGASSSWADGGGGIEPVLISGAGARARLDTGNVPNDDIELERRPGWVSVRYVTPDSSISALVLAGGEVSAPNSLNIAHSLLESQLTGIVNGDPGIAYERKPTLLTPRMPTFGIWLHLDFGRLVPFSRLRFYPRNTVTSWPSTPFQNDYLRGYEVWVDPDPSNSPTLNSDILVARQPDNRDAVVDVSVPPRYVRVVKLRSLANVPFEVDEIEVYGEGYLPEGRYYSDVIDLGAPATVGPLHWEGDTLGEPRFSQLQVRVRTGLDDTPIRLERLDSVYVDGDQDGVPDVAADGDTLFDIAGVEVATDVYWAVPSYRRRPPADDEENWSPWQVTEADRVPPVPTPRRYLQLAVAFEGRLADTRRLDRVWFEHLRPPLAHRLTAEVYPRLAVPEEPASFRYAVRMGADGLVTGFDRLEVDTNVPISGVRNLTIDGVAAEVQVIELEETGFRIGLPWIRRDSTVVEFTFDMPVFRFGTTFDGRVYHSRYPRLPQRLEPGQVVDFGGDDEPRTSGLSVAIPKERIGTLVGELATSTAVVTPNGDGINDDLVVDFNLLQLVSSVPAVLEVRDLSGRSVAWVEVEAAGIGPQRLTWDGTGRDGAPLPPGIYLWHLRILADAFEERHGGTVAVAY